jgi:hypothetical protein
VQYIRTCIIRIIHNLLANPVLKYESEAYHWDTDTNVEEKNRNMDTTIGEQIMIANSAELFYLSKGILVVWLSCM